jgi:hypothetical protein
MHTKKLAMALLLCAGTAWGQSAERSMNWHDLAFRTGFKAATAQACADLTTPQFASIQAEFAREIRDVGILYSEAYAKRFSDSFSAGMAMAQDSFHQQGRDLCDQLAPGDLQSLRDIVAGRAMVLPRWRAE